MVHIIADARPLVDVGRLSALIAQLPGIQGDGLVGAALQDGVLAEHLTALLQVVARLQDQSGMASGQRQNVICMAAFFLDAVYMLDAHGEALNPISGAVPRMTPFRHQQH